MPDIKIPKSSLIKVREAARFLAVSRATVHSLIHSGDLHGSKVSPSKKKKRQHVRITPESLCRFYEKRFGRALTLPAETPAPLPA